MGGMFRSRIRAVQRSRLRRGSAARTPAANQAINSTPIERVLALLHQLGQILLTLAIRPHRLDETINGDSATQRAVPKYTFLTVAIFAAVKTCKFLLMLFLIVNLEFLRGCDPVDQLPREQPLFQQELVVPSLVDIMLIGMPSALLIILLLVLVKSLLRLFIPARAAWRFFNISVYVAGFQYCVFTAAMIVWLPIRRPIEGGSASPVLEEVPLYSFLGALAWGVVLLTIALLRVTGTASASRSRLRKAMSGILALCAMSVVSLMVLSVGPLVALPLATREVESSAERPVLSVALLDLAMRPDGWPSVRLLVTNMSEQDRYIEYSNVVLLVDDLQGQAEADCRNGTLRLGQVREWQAAASPGHLLAPRAPMILNVDLAAYPDRENKSCGINSWEHALGKKPLMELLFPEKLVRYTPPDSYLARIRFDQVHASTGKRGELVGFVVGEDWEGRLLRAPETGKPGPGP